MDGGVAVLLHHPLRDQDRVLEVVAVPRHERDHHVLAQRQLAHVGGGAVRDRVAAGDLVAHRDQRPLVDGGVLVGTRVLGEVVDVHARLAGDRFVVVDPDHHATGIDRIHGPAALGDDRGAGVDGHGALDAGAHQRLVGTQARHGLTLHVRTHQGAVRVIVLEERQQRGRHRHDLLRRDIHVLDLVRGRDRELFLVAAGDEVVAQAAFVVHGRVRLGDHVLALLDRGEVDDLLGDLAVLDLAVRRLQEAVAVGAGVHRQRVDQADVRAFRGLDRADATVVRRMHVAHLEAGAFAGQAARAQRGDAALVRDLRQRVVLVHELRQLAGPEEFLDRGRHRLGVDQLLWHQALALGDGQTLLDRALDAHQAQTELVLGHLAHAADTSVAQVVDVVGAAVAVAQVDQDLEHIQDVLGRQHALALVGLATHAAIELHPPHGGEVVAILREEQVGEQVLRGVLGRRLARTHHAVDLDLRLQLRLGRIQTQGVRHVRTMIVVVGVDGLQGLHALGAQLVQQFLGQRVVGAGDQLAGGLVDHALGQHAAQQVFVRHPQGVDAGLLDLPDVAGGDAATRLDDDLVAIGDVDHRGLAAHALGDQVQLAAILVEGELVEFEKGGQDLFGIHAQCAQQDRRRQLAATVDAHVYPVLGVELEVQPGTAVRNDAGVIEQLLRAALRLALVAVEEHTRGTVQLRHDHAFGAIDDEGAVLGHERHFAHVDLLLLDLLDHGGARRGFLVVDHEAQQHAQRRCIGHATDLAFLHVEHRLAQAVAHVLELDMTGIADDGEYRLKRRVQAQGVTPVRRLVRLQEIPIGRQLGLEQVRDVEDLGTLPEVLADTFLFGITEGHGLPRRLAEQRGTKPAPPRAEADDQTAASLRAS